MQVTQVLQKWRFTAPQTHLWLNKHWFTASTFVVKIATFAKPENVTSNAMKTSATTNIIYSTSLLLTTLIIWTMLYKAQFLEYEDNYENILAAFFLSVFATVILTVLWFKWRHIVKTHKWDTILFLIISSPLTIFLVSINYPTIFGTTLKN